MNCYCIKYINPPLGRYIDKHLTDSQCLTFYIILDREEANNLNDNGPYSRMTCFFRVVDLWVSIFTVFYFFVLTFYPNCSNYAIYTNVI